MKKITKDMTLIDVLHICSDTVSIFKKHGLHCLGCPASEIESIEEVGRVHNIDVDALIEELNAYLNSKVE